MSAFISTRLTPDLLRALLRCGPLACELYLLLCEAGAGSEGGVDYSYRTAVEVLNAEGRWPKGTAVRHAISAMIEEGILVVDAPARNRSVYQIGEAFERSKVTRSASGPKSPARDAAPERSKVTRSERSSGPRRPPRERSKVTRSSTPPDGFAPSPPHPPTSTSLSPRRALPGSSVGRSEAIECSRARCSGSGGDALAEARSAGDGSAGETTDRPRTDAQAGRTMLDQALVASLVARIAQLPGLAKAHYGADQVGDLLEEVGIDALEQGIALYPRVDRTRWRSAVAAFERCCRDPGSMPLEAAGAAPPVFDDAARAAWDASIVDSAKPDELTLSPELEAMRARLRQGYAPKASAAAPAAPPPEATAPAALGAIAAGVLEELVDVAAPRERRAKGGRS